MVIVKLKGGIGNQMFQYAAAKRLTYLLGSELKLDITDFPDHNNRTFSLECFNIDIQLANTHEINSLKYCKETFMDRILNKALKPGPNYILEQQTGFCPEILELHDGVYLEGYWQSEKYFKDIESTIRNNFTFKTPPKGNSMKISRLIKSTESISIHVRRGDYINNPKTKDTHGTCSTDYFEKALEYFSEFDKNFHLFIFSDDLPWAKANLNFSHEVTFVSNNDNDFEDLRLMSLCKHNIIANSSFSWWGAWLNNHSDKTIIAPSQWFKNQNYIDADLLPENWIRVDNRQY
jgi:hypothetical protein